MRRCRSSSRSPHGPGEGAGRCRIASVQSASASRPRSAGDHVRDASQVLRRGCGEEGLDLCEVHHGGRLPGRCRSAADPEGQEGSRRQIDRSVSAAGLMRFRHSFAPMVRSNGRARLRNVCERVVTGNPARRCPLGPKRCVIETSPVLSCKPRRCPAPVTRRSGKPSGTGEPCRRLDRSTTMPEILATGSCPGPRSVL